MVRRAVLRVVYDGLPLRMVVGMSDDFRDATPRPWRWQDGMLLAGEGEVILWPHNAIETEHAAGWLGACGLSAEKNAEVNARLIVAAVNERDELRQALSQNGHDEPCVICSSNCSALSGNPSLWPVRLGNDGWRHVGCINKQLEERDELRQALEEAKLALRRIEDGEGRPVEWAKHGLARIRDILGGEK